MDLGPATGGSTRARRRRYPVPAEPVRGRRRSGAAGTWREGAAELAVTADGNRAKQIMQREAVPLSGAARPPSHEVRVPGAEREPLRGRRARRPRGTTTGSSVRRGPCRGRTARRRRARAAGRGERSAARRPEGRSGSCRHSSPPTGRVRTGRETRWQPPRSRTPERRVMPASTANSGHPRSCPARRAPAIRAGTETSRGFLRARLTRPRSPPRQSREWTQAGPGATVRP